MSKQDEWRDGSDGPDFEPVSLRARHDGWTPARQVAFVRALGQTACVVEACRAVGMSSESAYKLRARENAYSFREAWDAALDFSVARLADAAVGRAINGVTTPVFYKGEKIGERVRYDERLTMFILRTRAPQRFGRAAEAAAADPERPAEDGAGSVYEEAIERLAEEAELEERDAIAWEEEARAEAESGAEASDAAAHMPAEDRPAQDIVAADESRGDVPRPLSTSAPSDPANGPPPRRFAQPEPCHPALPWGSGSWSNPVLPPVTPLNGPEPAGSVDIQWGSPTSTPNKLGVFP